MQPKLSGLLVPSETPRWPSNPPPYCPRIAAQVSAVGPLMTMGVQLDEASTPWNSFSM